MKPVVEKYYKELFENIKTLPILSREETRNALLKDNFYKKIFGRSCNRKLIKENPILWKSILENTKELDEIWEKNLTTKINFIIKHNYDTYKIRCQKCSKLTLREDSLCVKCAPKYPSKEFFKHKFKENWEEKYKENRVNRISKSKGCMNFDWFLNKFKDEHRAHEEYIAHYKKIIQNKPYSKISQELFWKIYETLTDFEKVVELRFKELNDEKKIYLNLEERNNLQKIYFCVDFLYDNKIIEFLGDYWHKDDISLDFRKEILNKKGFDVLYIKESEYKRNKEHVISKCIEFIRSDSKINTQYEVLTKDGFVDFKGIKTVIKDFYICVSFDNNENINCSKDHIFFNDIGEILAEQLNVGDKIKTNNDYATVKKVELKEEKITLYDLIEVKNNMYLTNNIVSHNCSFLKSGNTVISIDDLLWYKNEGHIIDPIQKSNFDNHFWVWKHPDYDKHYLVTADVARGDGQDYSTVQVIDVEDVEQVAEYKGHIPPNVFGHFLVEVAVRYNNALLICENNTIGWATIQEIIDIGYKNLYWSSKNATFIDPLNVGIASKDKVPGFATTNKTRPLMLNKLEEAIRTHTLIFHSIRLYDEFVTFVYDEKSREAVPSFGYNDDLIIAMAMSMYVRATSLRIMDNINQAYKTMPGLYSKSSTPLPLSSREMQKKANPFIVGGQDISWLVK
jgi:very-short-patch-repair endonuclease